MNVFVPTHEDQTMDAHVYRYDFEAAIPMEDVEALLVSAISATQALHGDSATRLGVAHALDAERRACVIDARGDVAGDLNRLFVGFLQRQFGDEAFRITRISEQRMIPETTLITPHNWN